MALHTRRAEGQEYPKGETGEGNQCMESQRYLGARCSSVNEDS